ncbi:MAG TPA: FAD/NAD(P)-binding protein [Vicinamibacteria bacterium]|nr:FAD/NAD(P)-binding protein [Vicinamibacteria bacterium]
MAATPELAALAATDPMWPRPFTVRHAARETGDTFSLVLAPVDDVAQAAFLPGQFNMLYVFGVGEVPISISGDPARSELVHTIRAVGAVTRALQKLGKGDVVGVRGPYGSAWPVGQAQGHDVVIVAGGIGLAPLRPAICHLLLHRGLYGRVVVLYGARTPRDLLFTRELREWRGRFDIEVEVTVDRATTDWQGAVGVVTKLVSRSPFDAASAMAFVCGPEVMIRFSVMALETRGVPPSQVFVSLERNMKCGVGLCGHCQFGPHFICKDGPVFRYDRTLPFFGMREV